MPKKLNLFDSSIFWFIWLNCLEKPITIFEIQKRWKITSNYLYHKDKNFNRPIFILMKEKGYLEQEGNKYYSTLHWAKDYIKEYYKGTILEKYNDLIVEFCIKYRNILFSYENLIKLFGKDDAKWKQYGKRIFEIILFVLFFKDLEIFVSEHRAAIVIDLFKILLSPLSLEPNVLSYYNSIKDKILEPRIISTKSDVENLIKELSL